MDNKEIGLILRKAREKAGFSRELIADMMGKSPATIGHWETGHTGVDANTLFALCRIYGIDMNEAFGFANTVPTSSPCSSDASKIAAAYDRADEKNRKIAWLALEDFMETPVPAMATPHVKRTADESADTDTAHMMDPHWRENLSRWMKEHPNASVVSGGVPEWVEFNLIRAVYEEDLPGWSKEELRERAERMFRRPWTGKAEILFPSELALFRIDSEAAERRRKSGKDYSRFNESKTINLSCFRCPMVILCNQRREKAPFAELKRKAPSIYAADPDMAHIFNAEECPVYSLLKFSHPEISEWEIPKFSVDENGNFRLPAGNSALFAIFSMINPVFQAELDQALKPVGNDADDLGKM